MSECIFCRIGTGEIPSQMVYQDPEIIAFRDIHPQAPTHILIIPKKHLASLAELKTGDLPVVAHMIEAANKIAREQGISDGYRLVINTGSKAGQVVMHLHMHLLGGKQFSD
jgi:histidine triad (HIT) family protein